MKQLNWQNAYGPTPESFARHVALALEQTKEGQPVKKLSFRLVLVTLLILALCIGAVYAASVGLGIGDYFRRYSRELSPEAQQAIENTAPLGQTFELDKIKVVVTEAIADGKNIYLTCTVYPKDGENILLMQWDEALEGCPQMLAPGHERQEDDPCPTWLAKAQETGLPLVKADAHLSLEAVYGTGMEDQLLQEDGGITHVSQYGLITDQPSVDVQVSVLTYAVNLDDPEAEPNIQRAEFPVTLPVTPPLEVREFPGHNAPIGDTSCTLEKLVLTKTPLAIYWEVFYTSEPTAQHPDAYHPAFSLRDLSGEELAYNIFALELTGYTTDQKHFRFLYGLEEMTDRCILYADGFEVATLTWQPSTAP